MSDPDSDADDAPDAARYARNRERVKAGFWPKFRRVAARLPFAEDLLAAYYAALDSATPLRVRAGLFAALAYFVMPADMIPDVIAGLGYTDDAAVLMAALKTLGNHIRPGHRARARAALQETVEPPAS